MSELLVRVDFVVTADNLTEAEEILAMVLGDIEGREGVSRVESLHERSLS